MASKTVLIVDDTKAHRALTVRAVRALPTPCAVSECATLREAREALSRGITDLAVVILDVNLPDGDGADLILEIRLNPAYATLPIIMLSTSALESDRARALNRGANGYLTKASDFQAFVAEVSKALAPLL